MKLALKTLLAAAVATGAVALIPAAASAAIACTGDVCWHTHETYHYPHSARVVIHPDHWHHGPKVVIREHEGRGYWHGGSWVEW